MKHEVVSSNAGRTLVLVCKCGRVTNGTPQETQDDMMEHIKTMNGGK